MTLSQPKIELILSNKSKGESHYFATFIDDATLGVFLEAQI
jgi:hypothetical protein